MITLQACLGLLKVYGSVTVHSFVRLHPKNPLKRKRRRPGLPAPSRDHRNSQHGAAIGLMFFVVHPCAESSSTAGSQGCRPREGQSLQVSPVLSSKLHGYATISVLLQAGNPIRLRLPAHTQGLQRAHRGSRKRRIGESLDTRQEGPRSRASLHIASEL